MAMPIFAYLIIQGFFYTKSRMKYIVRLLILATITQIVITILGYINLTYYPGYWTGVHNYLGIVYSYMLSLILLTIIDEKTIIKKLNVNQNTFLRINILILIVLAYLKLRIEFDFIVPFMFLEFYAIEKLFMKENVLIAKRKDVHLLKRFIYLLLIFICLLIAISFIDYSPCNKYSMLYAILIIALYNGERGKDSIIIKYLFYLVFPLQHLFLYLFAMI